MKYKIIITAAFILFSICLKAQDKYQFMVIKYRLQGDPTLFISIDGDEFVKEKIAEPADVNHNVNPLLKKIKEYQNKGWEVMTFNIQLVANVEHYAYLRKKIETK